MEKPFNTFALSNAKQIEVSYSNNALHPLTHGTCNSSNESHKHLLTKTLFPSSPRVEYDQGTEFIIKRGSALSNEAIQIRTGNINGKSNCVLINQARDNARRNHFYTLKSGGKSHV